MSESTFGLPKQSLLFFIFLFFLGLLTVDLASASSKYEEDIFDANHGKKVSITFLGHGSLLLKYGSMTIYIDPVKQFADYSILPKANLILVTHEHFDHLDPETIATLSEKNTQLLLSEKCFQKINVGKVIKNGDRVPFEGVSVEAIAAYNLVHKKDGKQPFHQKGDGNGYLLGLGKLRIYIAGDTENIPEMKALKDIDIAFLPMNLPYTMTPEMVADAALAFGPKILYPYHFGQTDPQKLIALMKKNPKIEVRIRKLR